MSSNLTQGNEITTSIVGDGTDTGASEQKRPDWIDLIPLEYAKLGNLSKAAYSVGIDPSQVYRYKAKHPEFAEELKACERVIGDTHLERATEIAFNDKHQTSGVMTMFLLKRYHPEFRDSPQINTGAQDNRTINILIASDGGKGKLEELMQGGRMGIEQSNETE